MDDDTGVDDKTDPSIDDKINLGGSIELSGFRELDGGAMIILKKIVGNWARRFSDKTEGFEKLSMTVKTAHKTEKGEIYELHCKVINKGNVTGSSSENRNLFMAVDDALKKAMNEMK